MVECTVEKYFADTHTINLNYPNLPCLKVAGKMKNIYLPMEVKIKAMNDFSNYKFFL